MCPVSFCAKKRAIAQKKTQKIQTIFEKIFLDSHIRIVIPKFQSFVLNDVNSIQLHTYTQTNILPNLGNTYKKCFVLIDTVRTFP